LVAFNLSNRELNNSVQELFVVDDYIISLTISGICTSYNKCKSLSRLIWSLKTILILIIFSMLGTGDQKILNTNPREKIRSIFHN
jgi:hypothetical protein